MDDQYQKNAPDIQKRFFIRGRLELTSPTGLTNGDDGLTDIPIRRDLVSNRPLLPGTSLAGALRSYLTTHLNQSQSLVDKLFGNQTGKQSQQSWLFVDDALGQEAGIEIRDGVAINPQTRIAADKQKFDLELLAAGTTFDVALEFWQPTKDSDNKLLQLLAVALQGLTSGDIHLGIRKRRGFGACKVADWHVEIYDMRQAEDIIGWLEHNPAYSPSKQSIAEQLGVSLPGVPMRSRCRLKATFDLAGSLIIRSAPPVMDVENPPDVVHLRNAQGAPALSGTSVAGVLRAQSERILYTLYPDNSPLVTDYINDLFGPRQIADKKIAPRASRVWVKETVVDGCQPVIQPRVRIDRFTGGSYETALFSNEPVFGGQAVVDLSIDNPQPADVGLLLLLLKDLWTGFLPVGGEASVGRGRFAGKEATLDWNSRSWTIQQTDDGLTVMVDDESIVDAQTELQTAVAALKTIPQTNTEEETR